MKIALIGSTQYIDKFKYHRDMLQSEGHDVKLPAFDDIEGDELDVIDHNINIVKWADEIHVIWDARSIGTVFDMGVCMALGKKIRIVYLEQKTFPNLLIKYEKRCGS